MQNQKPQYIVRIVNNSLYDGGNVGYRDEPCMTYSDAIVMYNKFFRMARILKINASVSIYTSTGMHVK